MSPVQPWPGTDPSESPISVLIKLSRHYGANIDYVIAGGGNTSVKIGDRLFAKGSGHPLATITEDGFVEMDRTALEKILQSDFGTDPMVREDRFKAAIMAARVHPEKEQRPSVETLLHHLVPKTFVAHTHSTVANFCTCTADGEALAKKLFGDDILWIPDVNPGMVLAQTLHKAIQDYTRRTRRDGPRAILLQNHGLVVSGDTADEILASTEWIVSTLLQHISGKTNLAPLGPVTCLPDDQVTRLVNVIAPALRGLLTDSDTLKFVLFDRSPAILNLVGSPTGKSVALNGPLTPEQIVYCLSFPLWVELPSEPTPEAILEILRQAVKAYRDTYRLPPQIVLVKGLGLFAAESDALQTRIAFEVYADAVRIMLGAAQFGAVRHMPRDKREFIEKWEVEAYRRNITRKRSAESGRATGRIAVVTGAAQGFGFEIARDLAVQGAMVVLTDLNADGVVKAAADIVKSIGKDRAIGLPVNVTDGASVQAVIDEVVRRFGGLDLLVSNAGVLKAGSVKTQPEKDFDFVTAVNYKGFFLCVQKAAPVMAVQHQARPSYWSDIVEINSKSGLEGSSRNGAYAGSKFGGIGLTQSFALELVADGIKVNAICPGNFFDGPLWSDPNTGLFVQYLRAGKVPGAKTVEDVKQFYVSKVPMGRGCTGPDVMKAIYYLMEQKYETGQALPVTGGQVMLH